MSCSCNVVLIVACVCNLKLDCIVLYQHKTPIIADPI